MSGWQVGDLALCIKQGGWRRLCGGSRTTTPIRSGGVYRVRAVGVFEGRTVLWFPEHSGSGFGSSYVAARFRKVTPGTDIEGVEERRRIPVGEPA